MTEIVGGRQRLTEDDIREGIVATMTFREALAELASSGVPIDAHAAFYRRAAAAEIVRAWLARPQEQLRKATGEDVDTFLKSFYGDGSQRDAIAERTERALNAVFALSVSPAAAQGWQPIETAPKDGTEIIVWNGHERLIAEWRVPRSGADPYWHSVCGGSLNVLLWMPLAAAPASPAAQEQEKGEQT